MSRYGPTAHVSWMAGYSLAAEGALSGCTRSYVQETTDHSRLGRNGAVRGVIPTGRATYSLAEEGWYDTDETSLRDLLKAGAPSEPWLSLVGFAGETPGSPVTLATEMQLASHDVLAALEDLTRMSVEYAQKAGGEVYTDARIVTSRRFDGVDTGGTFLAANRDDNGAATNAGGVIAMMLDPVATRWRGYPTATLQLRHSANGSSWADLAAPLVITSARGGAAANTFALVKIASGTEIRRYVALRATLSGQRFSYTVDGQQDAGRTLKLKAGAPPDNIQPGDILEISGSDYTVETAELVSGTNNKWTVTFTTAHTGLANGVGVTHTGTNAELEIAAAIHRN